VELLGGSCVVGGKAATLLGNDGRLHVEHRRGELLRSLADLLI
jgi:hypothetical protein